MKALGNSKNKKSKERYGEKQKRIEKEANNKKIEKKE